MKIVSRTVTNTYDSDFMAKYAIKYCLYQRGVLSESDWQTYYDTEFLPNVLGSISDPFRWVGVAENFTTGGWQENDNYGTYIPAYTDPATGEYHPAHWSGRITPSSDGLTLNCTIPNNSIDENPYFVKDSVVGHFRNFKHLVDVTFGSYSSDDLYSKTPMISPYVITNDIGESIRINYQPMSHHNGTTRSIEVSHSLMGDQNNYSLDNTMFGDIYPYFKNWAGSGDQFELLSNTGVRFEVFKYDNKIVFIHYTAVKDFSYHGLHPNDTKLMLLSSSNVALIYPYYSMLDVRWLDFYGVLSLVPAYGLGSGTVLWADSIVVYTLDEGSNLTFKSIQTCSHRFPNNDEVVSYDWVAQVGLTTYDRYLNNTTNLYVYGRGNICEPSLPVPLLIDGIVPVNSNIPLITEGPDSYPYNTVLYIKGRIGVGALEWSAVNPLVLWNQQLMDSPTLFISGIPVPGENNSKLFIVDKTGLQDFTTYTNVAYTGYVSYTRIEPTTNSSLDGMIYKDMGADYFLFQWSLVGTIRASNINWYPMGISNNTANPSVWSDGVAVTCSGSTIYLTNFTDATTSTPITIQGEKEYYIRLRRQPDVGATHNITLTVFSDYIDGTEVGETTIEISKDTYHRYFIVAGVKPGSGSGTYMVENVRVESVFCQSYVPLLTKGCNPSSGAGLLYINGFGYAGNSFMPLQVFGGTDGWKWSEGATNLVVYDSQTYNGSAFLYVNGIENIRPFFGNGFLYTSGRGAYFNGSTTLAISQLGVSAGTRLFIQGPTQVYSGTVGSIGLLPIYVFRPNEANAISLCVFNDSPESNSFMTFIINGITGETTGNTTLAIPEVSEGYPNAYAALNIAGGVYFNSNLNLAVPNVVGVPNGQMTLVCFDNVTPINTYMGLFCDGIYAINSPVSLAMPAVYHIPVNNINLYTNGY